VGGAGVSVAASSPAGTSTAPPGARAGAAPAPIPGGLAGGLAPQGAGSLLLSGEHFAAALLYLALGVLGLVWVAPDVALGRFASPHVAGVTHLFTLGWLTTTIFGALYQLLPVALGAPIRSARLGHASFWTYAPGVALFACGIAEGSTMLHHAGIALVATGVLLFAANVALTLPRARQRDATWAAVAAAVGFLVLTLALGVALLHNIHTGFLAERRVRVLAIHVHVALIGWALVMIVGMSHRLLPMFLLAHGADTRWTRRALALLAAGLPLLVGGLALDAPAASWGALALLEAGVACFLVQARRFFRARIRPRLDAGMRFVAVGLCWLGASALLAPAVLALGAVRAPRLATAYVAIALLGGIITYVMGHFYKIVPFLAWIARFRARVGKEPVPTVAELYSSRVAHLQLACTTAAVALLAAGIALGSAAVTRAGAVLLAAGVALLASQAARVARRAPRPSPVPGA
ncbi:MAG TPA: hypothetical protein VFS05_12450, partial [Gemmatimonadaceae bacterium]|nr:hypothetical protein [Gemmatimonadaceae bacterium]